jgi:hypothetical protein
MGFDLLARLPVPFFQIDQKIRAPIGRGRQVTTGATSNPPRRF